jgi:hypothetical protein
MKRIIIAALSLALLSSCSSFRKNISYGNNPRLSESTMASLNGKYERYSYKKEGDSLPLADLYWNFYANTYSHILGKNDGFLNSSSTAFFEIKVLDKNKILVSYIDSNATIKSRIIRGKIKNGYFEVRRKYLFFTIVIANMYKDCKFRIKLSNEGNLTGDFKSISFGTLYFLIPYIDKDNECDKIFRRINDTLQ